METVKGVPHWPLDVNLRNTEVVGLNTGRDRLLNVCGNRSLETTETEGPYPESGFSAK